jgi:hypothetical protein
MQRCDSSLVQTHTSFLYSYQLVQYHITYNRFMFMTVLNAILKSY